MKIKRRYREWMTLNKSDLIIIVFGGLLGFAGVFALANELLSSVCLSGFAKYSIITIIDLLIGVPIYYFFFSLYYIFKKEIFTVWYQQEYNKQSVWNHFLFFIKNNALIFALVLIYVLFYSFWETWIGNHIIEPFLCHFESNLQNDIIFIIATIICLVLIYIKILCPIRGIIIKRVNQHTLIVSIIAIVIWAFYRFNHCLCGMTDSAYYMGFTPLSIFDPIKYFDFVLVFAIYEIMSYIFGKFQDILTQYFSFTGDNGLTRNLPIDEKYKDLLERDVFAKSVVKELWDTDTRSSSFTCGINAPWGSGKTSFINLMKINLKHEEFENKIIIDFNPWLYAAEKDLVTAFFDELSKTLKLYDKSLAKNLIDYAKLLSAFNTSETKLISSLLDLVQHDNDSLQEKKKHISESIISIERKIFVFIDDLDRLEANEILEMMKLIRNVSDFPYMYIIAAYDKSYVTQCMSTKMKSGANNFIEKIFEHEHILAPCSNESLRRALADELRKIDAGYFLKPKYEDYILDHNNKALDALSNLREIYRLSNNIASTYSLLKHEDVHGIDLLLLGLFKTKYPVAFSLFEHKWHEILVEVEHDNYRYYELFQGKDKDGYFDFIQYLDGHQEEMSMNEFDIKTIKMILSEMFKRQETVGDTHRIHDVRWFNRYLNLTQLKSDIPEKEFNEVMNKSFGKIKKFIDDWSVDKSVSLQYRLLNYGNNNRLNHAQLVKNIRAVLYASTKNRWNIYDQINRVIFHLKKFNGGTYSKEDHTFILDQLKVLDYRDFMIKYVGYLYVQRKYSEISLNETDLIETQQSIFGNCCKNMEIAGVLGAFNQLLNRKSDDFDSDQGIKQNDKYAISLAKSMQDYAKSQFKPFLQFVLYPSNKFFRINKITTVIWESWDHFRDDYLSTLDDSDPFIVEFKAFYKKFEENNYTRVAFDFQSIEQEK